MVLSVHPSTIDWPWRCSMALKEITTVANVRVKDNSNRSSAPEWIRSLSSVQQRIFKFLVFCKDVQLLYSERDLALVRKQTTSTNISRTWLWSLGSTVHPFIDLVFYFALT